jgi:hypothetical protein
VSKDPLIGAIGDELDPRKLSSNVGPELRKLTVALAFHHGLDALDGVGRIRLGRQEHDPHVASCIINE